MWLRRMFISFIMFEYLRSKSFIWHVIIGGRSMHTDTNILCWRARPELVLSLDAAAAGNDDDDDDESLLFLPGRLRLAAVLL
jgi:hypothetical protein